MLREQPRRPVAMASTVVFKDRRVLLIQMGVEPGYGHWSLPVGTVELGEKLQDAAARHAKNVAALDVEMESLVDVVEQIVGADSGNGDDADTEARTQSRLVVVVFMARWLAGEPKAATDVLAARWVTLEELVNLETSEWAIAVVRKAFDEAS